MLVNGRSLSNCRCCMHHGRNLCSKCAMEKLSKILVGGYNIFYESMTFFKCKYSFFVIFLLLLSFLPSFPIPFLLSFSSNLFRNLYLEFAVLSHSHSMFDKLENYACLEGNIIHRGLRVRIGIHFGEADIHWDECSGRADYYGVTINSVSNDSFELF